MQRALRQRPGLLPVHQPQDLHLGVTRARFCCTQGWSMTRRPSASFVAVRPLAHRLEHAPSGPTVMSEMRS